MPGTDCLTEDELLAFADGGLPQAEAARLNAHLAGCVDCRLVLAEVGRARETAPAIPWGDAPRRESSTASLGRGSSLGRYLVLEVLGSGGMGVVYAAYDPELDRRVAVKVLHAGIRDDEGSKARLVQEARAMARLSHPNVVAVFDAGAVDDRVFVAMELVTGETLRRWLLTPRTAGEILAAFTQAGRGLAAAHRAGIVHRDFKPENVLVAKDGRVCVLDFGLARPSGPSAPPEELGVVAVPGPGLTEAGTVMGTPRYMSPEQKDGKPSDPRSDQYAFCVALWEALHGALPGETPRRELRIPGAVRRAIEQGLAEDPGKRHPSMEPLLAELGRDRAARRRRWLWLSVAAAIALAGVGIGGWRERSVRRLCRGGEETVASVWGGPQRGKAHQAFQGSGRKDAEDLWGAVAGSVDRYAGAWASARQSTCEATRLRGEQSEELLDLRMLCLDDRLEELRAVAAALEGADARVLAQAGGLTGLLGPLAQCADSASLLARVRPPADPAARERIERLRGRLAKVKALRLAARIDEAIPEAESLAKDALAEGYDPLTADALSAQGELLATAGRVAEGEQAQYQAVAAAMRGRYAEGEARAWVRLADAVGVMERRSQDGRRLLALARAAVASLKKPESLGYALGIVEGNFEDLEGNGEAAVASFRAALLAGERERGPNDPLQSQALLFLGQTLSAQGKDAEAEGVFRRCETILAADPLYRGQVDLPLDELAAVLMKQHRLAEAAAALDRAVAAVEASDGHPLRLGRSLELRAKLARDQGRFADAAKDLERSLAGLGRLPDADLYRPEVLVSLGQTHAAGGEPAKAAARFEEALAGWARTGGESGRDTLTAWVPLATARAKLGDRRGAIAALERALAIHDQSHAEPEVLAPYRWDLAEALWELGHRRDRAVALATAARDAFAKAGNAASVRELDAWLGAHRLPSLPLR